jgi:hypothetical protein
MACPGGAIWPPPGHRPKGLLHTSCAPDLPHQFRHGGRSSPRARPRANSPRVCLRGKQECPRSDRSFGVWHLAFGAPAVPPAPESRPARNLARTIPAVDSRDSRDWDAWTKGQRPRPFDAGPSMGRRQRPTTDAFELRAPPTALSAADPPPTPEKPVAREAPVLARPPSTRERGQRVQGYD